MSGIGAIVNPIRKRLRMSHTQFGDLSDTVKATLGAQCCCDLCGCEEMDLVVDRIFPDQQRLVRCRHCGLVRLTGGGAVSHDYWQEDICGLDVYTNPTYREEAERRYEKYLETITRLAGDRGLLLDAGCGPGNFLRFARNCGWEVRGVEISEKAASRAKDFGLEVETAQIENTHWPDDAFDVITMWDLVEHLESPRRAVDVIHRKLRAGGLLFLETPDDDFWIRRVLLAVYRMSSGCFDLTRYFYFPDHRYYFTAKTITTLLTQAGFQIISVAWDLTPISKLRLKISPWRYPLKRLVLGALPLLLKILRRLDIGNKLIVLARKP